MGMLEFVYDVTSPTTPLASRRKLNKNDFLVSPAARVLARHWLFLMKNILHYYIINVGFHSAKM